MTEQKIANSSVTRRDSPN